MEGDARPLRVRWLGRVAYREALDLQHRLFEASPDDHLLLLEHPDTLTLGVRADAAHVLVDPGEFGGDVVEVDRGGDVTYHGPGQLVGYPILTIADHARGEVVRTRDYIEALESVLIAALADVGLPGAGILDGYPGVWLDVDGPRPRKIAAIGVRISRGRTMHGFALNVDCDLARFDTIVPCGLTLPVTSVRAEGLSASMEEVTDAVVARFVERFGASGDGARDLGGPREIDRADVVWRTPADGRDLTPFSRGAGPGEATKYARPGSGPSRGRADAPPAPAAAPSTGTSVRLLGRLAEAGVSGGVALAEPKPDWMRAKLRLGPEVARLGATLRDLHLVTVCEEAGCPNLSECWAEGTATFMVCGERCTRACGFCLVDTRKPEALDPDEPARVAEAVRRMGLDFVVVTMVARDDLADGGAAHVAATVEAVRSVRPEARIEVLISDLGGDPAALDVVLASRPDVVNHNIETVPRLQRAARPSASYARSLTLLARSAAAGMTTKSGIVAGMGETDDEVRSTMADLAAVGVDIVTIGQYLRPTSHHLPVACWWPPEQFDEWKRHGEQVLGLAHVESSPFTRSSHHAGAAADAAAARRA